MTIQLRGGYTTEDQRLDRLPSETTEHLEKYPLTAATMPTKPASMTMGVNWYSNFDDPIQMRIGRALRWVIGHGSLGSIRGGHATCLRHEEIEDALSWWYWYNQLKEGRCVEFATLRMLSHLNRVRYDTTGRWVYYTAQRNDEWQGGSYAGATPQYDGTSTRAGLQVVLDFGPIREQRGKSLSHVAEDIQAKLVVPSHGISAFRWATNWQDVRTALGTPDWLPGVRMLNSWGSKYPREVLLLDEAGERILNEDGEFGIVTDR